MANAVFTIKVSPSYNDIHELRYHFPRTYLRQASQAVGDWVIYYEPRREDANLAGRSGRQAYFAVARLRNIEPDPERAGHYYAYVSDYLEFERAVPFREGSSYYEAALRKADGTTNKGAFGRSVRVLPVDEFQAILKAGFASIDPPEFASSIEEEPPSDRLLIHSMQERAFRDVAFGKIVRRAYGQTCAMTGLSLVSESRCEVQAAHIKPVSALGPDSPRNGIALSRTVHWLFDEGALSVSDSGEILIARDLVPSKVRQMLNADNKVLLPSDPAFRPHPAFLKFHRDCFKG